MIANGRLIEHYLIKYTNLATFSLLVAPVLLVSAAKLSSGSTIGAG